MKRRFKETDHRVRKVRMHARDPNSGATTPKIQRVFDAVAYAAALEVLG